PALVTVGIDADLRIWADSLGTWDRLDLAWTLSNPNVFTVSALAEAVPSIRYRYQLQGWIAAALNSEGGGYSFWMYNLAHIRNRNRNRGAYVADKNPRYRGEVPLPYRSLLLGEERPCNPMVELYTHRLLRLAEEHGVRVYAVIFPFSPRLQKERQAKGLDTA